MKKISILFILLYAFNSFSQCYTETKDDFTDKITKTTDSKLLSWGFMIADYLQIKVTNTNNDYYLDFEYRTVTSISWIFKDKEFIFLLKDGSKIVSTSVRDNNSSYNKENKYYTLPFRLRITKEQLIQIQNIGINKFRMYVDNNEYIDKEFNDSKNDKFNELIKCILNVK